MVRLAIDSTRAVGLEITIFNPALDIDGSIGEALVRCLLSAGTAVRVIPEGGPEHAVRDAVEAAGCKRLGVVFHPDREGERPCKPFRLPAVEELE